MKTPATIAAEERARRGRRHGQAVKSYGNSTAKTNALIAILGQDYVDHSVELSDCSLAAEHCPDHLPTKLNPRLTSLAWRMLHALKRGDSAWFKKLLAVREGEAFKRLRVGSGFKAVDPLRTILARLAQLQEDGRHGPITSVDELEAFVAERDETAVPSNTKTLQRAAIDVGVRCKMRRGPKPGRRIDHGIN